MKRMMKWDWYYDWCSNGDWDRDRDWNVDQDTDCHEYRGGK